MALKEDIKKIGMLHIGNSFHTSLAAKIAVSNLPMPGKLVMHVAKDRSPKFGRQSITIINPTNKEAKVRLEQALKTAKDCILVIDDFDLIAQHTKITGKLPKYSTKSIKNRLRKCQP